MLPLAAILIFQQMKANTCFKYIKAFAGYSCGEAGASVIDPRPLATLANKELYRIHKDEQNFLMKVDFNINERLVGDLTDLGNLLASRTDLCAEKVFATQLKQRYTLTITEFLPKGSLDFYLINKPLDFSVVRDWFLRIARCFEGLHEAGIIHGNVTPSNIFFTDDFSIRVRDFSSAVFAHSIKAARGTYGYVAPEVLHAWQEGVVEWTPKQDVFSLGVIFYEMLSGGRRFWNVHHQDFLAVLTKGYFTVYQYTPNVLARVVTLMMKTDPAERPSLSEVIDLLEGAPDFLNHRTKSDKTIWFNPKETFHISMIFSQHLPLLLMFLLAVLVGLVVMVIVLLGGVGKVEAHSERRLSIIPSLKYYSRKSNLMF